MREKVGTSQRFRIKISRIGDAIATLAMTEAYGLTRSPLFKSAAEKGIAFCLKCQNENGGWRYGIADGQNDTAVTGWMVMALKSAKAARIHIDDKHFASAITWVEKMTDKDTGRVGYMHAGKGSVRSLLAAETFPNTESEALTAEGICARVFSGQNLKRNKMIKKGTILLTKKLPQWDKAKGSIDMFYWYFGTLAMYRTGGTPWKEWSTAMKHAMIDTQCDDGNSSGSWDPAGVWGKEGGRVLSTALMTMCLEVYYRYGRAVGTR